MNNTRNFATYVLAGSIFSFAAALVYFTFTLAAISEQIPQILTSVESTSKTIEPVVKEVSHITELTPQIIDEVQKTRELIPSILESTDKASEAIIIASKEIEATRPLVPEVLKEVKATREAVPPLLDQAQALVSQAGKAGQEASKGAVTGVVTGIFTAPFTFVGEIGRSFTGSADSDVKKLEKSDIDLADQAAMALLESGQIKESKSWNNSKTGHHGIITLISKTKQNGHDCRVLNVRSWVDDETKEDKNITVCEMENGQWEIKN
ncbi:MAG: hypothetical protein HKM94_09695 [Halobacteria archaeon]|nr:hypothetical protein [Halobacteria archaeon]